jgi:hypothetical protein
MLQQVQAMSFPSIKTPSLVSFIPSLAGGKECSNTVLVASADGTFSVGEVSGESSATQTSSIYLNDHDTVTSVCTSSTGALMAIGTSAGFTIQYAHAFRPKVNVNSRPTDIPKSTHKPLLALPPESPVIGTSYVLKPKPYDPLASLFSLTPSVLTRRLRLSSARSVNAQLLATATYHDFLGILPNPGVVDVHDL